MYETITISVKQYSRRKLQLHLLGGRNLLKKFQGNIEGVLIRKGGGKGGDVRQKSRKLKSGENAYLALESKHLRKLR